MREAIEHLIADLKFRREEAYQAKVGNEGKKISAWHEGRSNELGFVIIRLEAVLECGTDDGSRISGNVGQEAKQIPSETDSG